MHLARKSKAPSILKKCFVYNDRFLLGFPHGKYLYENGNYRMFECLASLATLIIGLVFFFSMSL